MSKKILTAYYSHSGNTGEIASYIQKQTNGALFEIIPAVLYPTGYNDVVRQAKIEIQSGKKPELKTKINDTESYDIIFVGSPNWWGTIAPPVAAFLSEHDFSLQHVSHLLYLFDCLRNEKIQRLGFTSFMDSTFCFFCILRFCVFGEQFLSCEFGRD